MAYIHCERCGTSCYSNVLSCPRCKAPVARAYTQPFAVERQCSSAGDEEVESEVRNALYSWRSGCVQSAHASQ